jgi:hypothetical protein
VQARLEAGGVAPKSLEIQGVRRLREVRGVALVSLRAQIVCEPAQLPKLLATLRQGEFPTLVDSADIRMERARQRQKWEVSITLSTPALETDRGRRG